MAGSKLDPVGNQPTCFAMGSKTTEIAFEIGMQHSAQQSGRVLGGDGGGIPFRLQLERMGPVREVARFAPFLPVVIPIRSRCGMRRSRAQTKQTPAPIPRKKSLMGKGLQNGSTGTCRPGGSVA